MLQSLISEVQIYKKDEIKESKIYIKKIKFAFDIENIGEILDNKENHVGLYCLPTKKRQCNQRKSQVWRR